MRSIFLILSILLALQVTNAFFIPKQSLIAIKLNKYFEILTSKENANRIQNSLLKSIISMFLDYYRLMANQKYFSYREKQNALMDFEKIQESLSSRLQTSLTAKNLIDIYEFMKKVWQNEKAKELKMEQRKKFEQNRKHMPFRWG